MRTDKDLSAWMVRLVDGDRTAIDPLYRALWPIVHSFCVRRLGGSDDADDAAQHALIAVFERASSFDVARPVLPWVLAFATWECRTIARKRQRRREDEMTSEGRDPGDLERDMLRADLASTVRETLGELMPADEAALWAWMERDVREEGPMSSGLRKRLQRARTRFASAWGRHHGSA